MIAAAISVASDFPSYLRQQLTDALSQNGLGVEIARQLYAAGLLTYGHIEMVDVILSNMPPDTPPKRATGYCVAAPSYVLSRLLPLPDALKTSPRSVVDAVQVREWFEKHRGNLKWDAATERVHLLKGCPTRDEA